MSDVTNTKIKIPKTEIYKNKNLSVLNYNFTIQDWDRKGEVLELIEIVTIKKKWSQEINAFFDKRSFITISKEEFSNLIKSFTK